MRVVKCWNRLHREMVGVSIPGSVQSQTKQGFEQPTLVEGVPVRGRGVGTR